MYESTYLAARRYGFKSAARVIDRLRGRQTRASIFPARKGERMVARACGAAVVGIDVCRVEIEVDVGVGLPSFAIVGLPDAAVQEARERVRAGIANGGFDFPLRRITVNLAPADVRKQGPVFDLPMAAAVLEATGQITPGGLREHLLAGELSLDGSVRAVNGVLAMALFARETGSRGVVVPAVNAAEARLIAGVEVVGVSHLRDVAALAAGRGVNDGPACPAALPARRRPRPVVDFAEVRGQEQAKRALEVAAGGNHNVLMVGPPGSGKTMLARRLPTIMPVLDEREALDVTKLYSIAGLLSHGTGLMRERPFRAPHHSISIAGLTGGGGYPRPGEISLSHRGVLFLDELPEFSRGALEALRQPLEDRTVTIRRANCAVTYPTEFLLVGAMNPCPCGYLADSRKRCDCTPPAVERYRHRISGPLLDRIDITIEVARLEPSQLMSGGRSEASADIRRRVKAASLIRRERERSVVGANRGAGASEVSLRHLSGEARVFLEDAVDRMALSARAYARTLRVARTIADLEGSEIVEEAHLAEAAQYRSTGWKEAR